MFFSEEKNQETFESASLASFPAIAAWRNPGLGKSPLVIW
jgi:hypothetical protein